MALCTEGKKRGRTEFTTDLIVPVQVNEDLERGCWVATLPAIQLNHEQGRSNHHFSMPFCTDVIIGIKEDSSRECYLNSHRYSDLKYL